MMIPECCRLAHPVPALRSRCRKRRCRCNWDFCGLRRGNSPDRDSSLGRISVSFPQHAFQFVPARDVACGAARPVSTRAIVDSSAGEESCPDRASKLGHARCAVSSGSNVYVRFESDCSFVFRSYTLAKSFGMFTGDQVDGATAESASRHAGSEDSSLGCGNFDHDVEFTATHLIVISQTHVRFGHQPTESSQIIFLKHLGGAFYPSIFRHHMTAAPIDDRRQHLTMPLKLLHGNIPERTNAWYTLLKNFDAFFAVCPALVVFATGMLVLHHRVADHDGCAW